jgi:hypothetical protein
LLRFLALLIKHCPQFFLELRQKALGDQIRSGFEEKLPFAFAEAQISLY